MNYIVTFLTDQGKLHIKDRLFLSLDDARHYAGTISPDRFPVVSPYGHSVQSDLLKVLEALVTSLRTFRNVPLEQQMWTSFDDDALEVGFASIAKAKGE